MYTDQIYYRLASRRESLDKISGAQTIPGDRDVYVLHSVFDDQFIQDQRLHVLAEEVRIRGLARGSSRPCYARTRAWRSLLNGRSLGRQPGVTDFGTSGVY